MNPNTSKNDQDYVGYGAYFEGQRLGTVRDDRLRPASGQSGPRRVVTLDNGMALLDPFSETAVAEGFVLRSPAEEGLSSRSANALSASPVVREEENGADHADQLCLV